MVTVPVASGATDNAAFKFVFAEVPDFSLGLGAAVEVFSNNGPALG
jgi:hypothetical protein